MPFPLPLPLIHSIRYGHATNSSSTHSLVWLPTPQGDDDVSNREFGWSYWTAGSREAKRDYCWICLEEWVQNGPMAQSANLHSLGDLLGLKYDADQTKQISELYSQQVKLTTSLIAGYSPSEEGGYVDHQSRLSFPLNRNGWVSPSFYRWFIEQTADDDHVVFLGGNDNDDQSHGLGMNGEAVYADQGIVRESTGMFVRDDVSYWTLWSKGSGDLIRVGKVKGGEAPKKGVVPDSIDVKITDQCNFKSPGNNGQTCTFCYQGSTPQGKHADFSHLRSILTGLEKLGVIEIALGGGEPTEHPHFAQILKEAGEKGMTVNVTTRNLDGLFGNLLPTFLDHVNGIGLSIDSADDVRGIHARYALLSQDHRFNLRNKIQFHVVLGTMPSEAFWEIMEAVATSIGWDYASPFAITLLGYKAVGRGATVAHGKPPFPYDGKALVADMAAWRKAEVLTELVPSYRRTRVSIGVDAALLAEVGAEAFTAVGIDPKTLVGREGAFSCYVDAVALKAAPSSYCRKDQFVSISTGKSYDAFDVEAFKKAWASW